MPALSHLSRRIWIALWVVTAVAAYVLGSSGVLADVWQRPKGSVTSEEIQLTLLSERTPATTTLFVDLVFPEGGYDDGLYLCSPCEVEFRFEDFEITSDATLSFGEEVVLSGGEASWPGDFDGDDFIIYSGTGGSPERHHGQRDSYRYQADRSLTIEGGTMTARLSVRVRNVNSRYMETPFPRGTSVELWRG